MSSSDDKREIKRLNEQLRKRGAKSRYIDSAPETDFTLSEDEHAADKTGSGTMANIPLSDQAKAQSAEEATAAQLRAKGLGAKYGLEPAEPEAPSVPRQTRLETVKRMIDGMRVIIGKPYDHHLDEFYELTGRYHYLDPRVSESKDPGRLP